MILSLLAAAGALACAEPRIIDGDTFACGHVHVRLYGIDAPELHGRAHEETYPGRTPSRASAYASRDRLEQLAGHGVDCTPDGNRQDRYGRLVARCRSALSTDLGRQLVREGWAVDWPRYSGGEYAPDQAAARRDHRGMWR